ncbi:hypothetical protein HDU98_004939, partial [Podochytrium sp. JEL0797]
MRCDSDSGIAFKFLSMMRNVTEHACRLMDELVACMKGARLSEHQQQGLTGFWLDKLAKEVDNGLGKFTNKVSETCVYRVFEEEMYLREQNVGKLREESAVNAHQLLRDKNHVSSQGAALNMVICDANSDEFFRVELTNMHELDCSVIMFLLHCKPHDEAAAAVFVNKPPPFECLYDKCVVKEITFTEKGNLNVHLKKHLKNRDLQPTTWDGKFWREYVAPVAADPVGAGIVGGIDAGAVAGVGAGIVGGIDMGAVAGVGAGIVGGINAGAVAGVGARIVGGIDMGAVAGVGAGIVGGIDVGAVAGVGAGIVGGIDMGAVAGGGAGIGGVIDAVDAGAVAGVGAGIVCGVDAGAVAGVGAGIVPEGPRLYSALTVTVSTAGSSQFFDAMSMLMSTSPISSTGVESAVAISCSSQRHRWRLSKELRSKNNNDNDKAILKPDEPEPQTYFRPFRMASSEFDQLMDLKDFAMIPLQSLMTATHLILPKLSSGKNKGDAALFKAIHMNQLKPQIVNFVEKARKKHH